MRWEFVSNYYKPLCSDGFTQFVHYDPNQELYKENLKEAYFFIKGVLAPAFALWLDNEYSFEDFKVKINKLTEIS